MIKDARSLAVTCARLAHKKKAREIVILNLRKLTFLADYFVICSADSPRQLRAIADALVQKVKKTLHLRLFGLEGYTEGSWIVLDLGDVVVHLFREDLRRFYDLEFIWSEAPWVRWGR